MQLDQQYPIEHAFRGGAKILSRFGSLDPAAIATADPDAFKALAEDVVVTSVDAWYLHGATPNNAHPLEQMAKRIYLQWFY